MIFKSNGYKKLNFDLSKERRMVENPLPTWRRSTHSFFMSSKKPSPNVRENTRKIIF